MTRVYTDHVRSLTPALASALHDWECRRQGDYITWIKPESTIRVVLAVGRHDPDAGTIRIRKTVDWAPVTVATVLRPRPDMVPALLRVLLEVAAS